MNEEVSSELYTEYKYDTNASPILTNHYVVSKFPFNSPLIKPQHDEDGDLIVQRVPGETTNAIEIEHSSSTCLDLVGLQVWRGSLLLADWVLYMSESLKNKTVLELGSGTGLTSIICAMFAPVICTDIDKGNILKLIRSNINRNSQITKFPIRVTEMDFTWISLPNEIVEHLRNINVVLAADVIYDDKITVAFVKLLKVILNFQPKCLIYIAIERRYVFTIADCDVAAPCYEYFLESLAKHNLYVQTIPINFPKYFKYDRTKELVLCKIYLK